KTVAEDVLTRILQAARMAGSAKNAQPVRLVVLRDQARKARLAECGRFTPHVVASPVVLAIVLVPELGVVGAPFTIFRGPFDAGRAAQNIMLAAWNEGIGSCPASMHDAEAAAVVLGLPEGHVVANLIALGYPQGQDSNSGGRPRLPLDDYIHNEVWGSGSKAD
ncbi:MAG: nitroreductase family protein, partial [Tepidiformaceae bacterium]